MDKAKNSIEDLSEKGKNAIKKTVSKLGVVPIGTVSAISIQLQSKRMKTISIMLSVGLYSAGTSFIAYFLISHMRNYIATFGLPADDASSIFTFTAALAIFIKIISAVIGGSISDDLRGKFGNRLPLILGGAVFAGIIYFIGPFMISGDNIYLTLPLFYGLIAIGLGFTVSPQQALISELFNKEERGWAGLVFAGMDTIGTVLGMIILDSLTDDYTMLWGVTGIGLIIFATLTFIFTPKTNPAFPPDDTIKDILRTPEYLLKLGSGDMWKVFIVQMIWGTAIYTVTLNFKNFLETNIFATTSDATAEANLVLLVLGVAAGLSGIPIGFIIQKLGKIKSSMIGTACYAVFALLLTLDFTTADTIYFVAIFGAFGSMFITTLSIALPSDIVPKGKEGQFMGIFILANGLPRGIFLLIGKDWDYAETFIAVGLLLVLAIFILIGIQYEKMIDSEYRKFYERYIVMKGFVLDTLEDAVEVLKETADTTSGFFTKK